jgi:arylsulfatase A
MKPIRIKLLILLALLLNVVAAFGATREKPNILLILADDLGAECLGCYGGTSYRTPNLDELARTGLRFANCYATPLCSPSRVELMTGRYGFRTGWTNLIDRDTPEFLNPKEFNFAHLLKSAGYRTAVAGKWQLAEFEKHPNHVNECGFDEYRCWAWKLDGRRTERYWNPVTWENGKARVGKPGEYGEDLFSDFLIDFMKRNQSNSFFAYYPMTLVHAPFDPTPDSGLATGRKKQKKAESKSNFPAMVAYMDKTVGKLVAALDEVGLREKTLILFTGDNGTARDVVSKANGLQIRGGKGNVTHIGAHVPLIASWKGTVKRAKVLQDLVDFSDVFPTLAELAYADTSDSLKIDGRSFAPQLRGQHGNSRDWIFVQLGDQRLIRDERWLLHDDGRVYDPRCDPLERKNLARELKRKHEPAIEKLREVLATLK